MLLKGGGATLLIGLVTVRSRFSFSPSLDFSARFRLLLRYHWLIMISILLGIGLEVHEHPYLNSGNTEQLIQPGETFSNEPGIYIEQAHDTEGSGIGVRLEDMVLKTEKGWELISGSALARSPCDP